MAPIVVVGGACSFTRDHRRSQWVFRSTSHAKRGTIRRLLQSLQNLGADALGGFVYCNFTQIEDSVRVKSGVFLAQTQTTLRDRADAAPLLVCDFKHLSHDLLR